MGKVLFRLESIKDNFADSPAIYFEGKAYRFRLIDKALEIEIITLQQGDNIAEHVPE